MKKFILSVLITMGMVLLGVARVCAICMPGDVTGPPKVGNVTVTGVSATGFLLSFITPPDASPLKTIDLRYRIGGPITAQNWASPSVTQVIGEPAPAPSGTTQVTNVSGLAPGTTFSFALKISDDCNKWSPMSNAIPVITPSAPPMETTLNFSWTKNSDGETVGYKLYYGPKSRNAPDFTGYPYSVDIGNKMPASLIVQGSGPYNITIVAYNAARDESGYGNEVPWSK